MAKNILIIDDDKLIAITLRRLLTREGYDVTTALNGLRAISLVKQNEFDLIMSDIKMPQMDGIETVKRIRALRKEGNLKPIPEIFITAYAKEEIFNEALALGACGYLQKPFDITALRQIVGKAVENA
jgi:CheY-like chemotaxis protein